MMDLLQLWMAPTLFILFGAYCYFAPEDASRMFGGKELDDREKASYLDKICDLRALSKATRIAGAVQIVVGVALLIVLIVREVGSG